jgi:hypothetical protein
MKKFFLVVVLILFSTNIYAKKVKFAVDMTGQTINPTGVHVAGDFQTLAGFPDGDWTSNSTPLKQESGTDIYSIVVDIPAMAKYEYKFLNGDQWYDVEFVPVESRVGYDFNDNRWLFVDSLANDTTFVGAILFSGNAPSGLTLVRFVVDLQYQQEISENGIHIAGDYQEWNSVKDRLYSFGNDVYETILYFKHGTYEYKYINGNKSTDEEIVPAECSIDGKRNIQVDCDIVLETICYSYCTDCKTADVNNFEKVNSYSIFPNPTENSANILLNENKSYNITITDLSGCVLKSFNNFCGSEFTLYRNNLVNGIYFVNIHDIQDNNDSSLKIIFK